MQSRIDVRAGVGAFFGLALGLSATSSQAQDPPAESPPPVHITQRPQQILPTGEEDAPARVESFSAQSARTAQQSLDDKLREMTSESAEGLQSVKRPNGAIGLDLQGRFMNVVVAKQREDGTFEVSCHTGDEALSEAHHAADILAGRADKLKRKPLPPVTITRAPVALEEK